MVTYFYQILKNNFSWKESSLSNSAIQSKHSDDGDVYTCTAGHRSYGYMRPPSTSHGMSAGI